MKYGPFREKNYSNCEVARETRRNPRLFQRSQESQRKQTKRSVRLLHAENVSSWKKLLIRNAPTREISKLLTTFVTWKISAANSRVYAVVETEAKDVSPILLERYKQTSLGFHSSGLGLRSRELSETLAKHPKPFKRANEIILERVRQIFTYKILLRSKVSRYLLLLTTRYVDYEIYDACIFLFLLLKLTCRYFPSSRKTQYNASNYVISRSLFNSLRFRRKYNNCSKIFEL